MSSFEDKLLAAINDQSPVDSVEDDGLAMVNVSTYSNKNKRVAPRCVRDDIVVVLCETTPLSFGREIFMGFVELNDITGRGISFSSSQYLPTHKKILLHMQFRSKMTFKIPSTIVYRVGGAPPYQYGIKFDEDNYELSDHLLETQLKLIFK
jgi:hypothetical protein